MKNSVRVFQQLIREDFWMTYNDSPKKMITCRHCLADARSYVHTNTLFCGPKMCFLLLSSLFFNYRTFFAVNSSSHQFNSAPPAEYFLSLDHQIRQSIFLNYIKFVDRVILKLENCKMFGQVKSRGGNSSLRK